MADKVETGTQSEGPQSEDGALARVKVFLPAALLRLFPEAEAVVEMNARTVDDVLHQLELRWPGMRDRLADTTPAIRRHLNIFVDGDRANLDTRLDDGTEVVVLTAMSGG